MRFVESLGPGKVPKEELVSLTDSSRALCPLLGTEPSDHEHRAKINRFLRFGTLEDSLETRILLRAGKCAEHGLSARSDMSFNSLLLESNSLSKECSNLKDSIAKAELKCPCLDEDTDDVEVLKQFRSTLALLNGTNVIKGFGPVSRAMVRLTKASKQVRKKTPCLVIKSRQEGSSSPEFNDPLVDWVDVLNQFNDSPQPDSLVIELLARMSDPLDPICRDAGLEVTTKVGLRPGSEQEPTSQSLEESSEQVTAFNHLVVALSELLRRENSLLIQSFPGCGRSDCVLKPTRPSAAWAQIEAQVVKVESYRNQLKKLERLRSWLHNYMQQAEEWSQREGTWDSYWTDEYQSEWELGESFTLPKTDILVPSPKLTPGETKLILVAPQNSKFPWSSSWNPWVIKLIDKLRAHRKVTDPKVGFFWWAPHVAVQGGKVQPPPEKVVNTYLDWRRNRLAKLTGSPDICWVLLADSFNQAVSKGLPGERVKLPKSCESGYKERTKPPLKSQDASTTKIVESLKAELAGITANFPQLASLTKRVGELEEQLSLANKRSEEILSWASVTKVPDLDDADATWVTSPLLTNLISDLGERGRVILELTPDSEEIRVIKPSKVPSAPPKAETRSGPPPVPHGTRPKAGSPGKGKLVSCPHCDVGVKSLVAHLTRCPQAPKGLDAGTKRGSRVAGGAPGVQHGETACQGHLGLACHDSVECPCPHCKWEVVESKPASRSPSPAPKEQRGKKDTKKGKSPKENPLGVRGVPKLRATLSEGEYDSLRAFFKVPTPISPEDWDLLTNEQRVVERKKRALPRWAVTSVRSDGNNLQRILDGKITAEKQKGTFSKIQPKQAENAWKSVKGKFPGIALLERPKTTKEKNFRKEFDTLVGKYGSLNCFPTPKRSGRTARRSESPRREDRGESRSPFKEITPILELIKEFGAAFAAFRA